MQENKFSTYQKFTNKVEVEEFSKFLRDNKIEFEVEDNSISFDPTFANNDFGKFFCIKLRSADFEKVDEMQNEISNNLSESIDKDHYLYDFTDQELIEVVVKSDEWSKLDFSLAQKILLDSNLANFLFTIKETKEGFSLEGLEGSTWKELSFSCSGTCHQFIDENGMTDGK